MVPLLDELLWRMVRQRWALAGGVPKRLTLMMDSFLLKIPRHRWLDAHRSDWRFSARSEAVFAGEDLWTATGTLWGARLLTVQTTRPVEGDGELELGDYEVLRQADVLTNIAGIHALTAWRLYNRGAVVEQRIEELAQLSAGAFLPGLAAGAVTVMAVGLAAGVPVFLWWARVWEADPVVFHPQTSVVAASVDAVLLAMVGAAVVVAARAAGYWGRGLAEAHAFDSGDEDSGAAGLASVVGRADEADAQGKPAAEAQDRGREAVGADRGASGRSDAAREGPDGAGNDPGSPASRSGESAGESNDLTSPEAAAQRTGAASAAEDGPELGAGTAGGSRQLARSSAPRRPEIGA